MSMYTIHLKKVRRGAIDNAMENHTTIQILQKVEHPCACSDEMHEQPCQREGVHKHYGKDKQENYWICLKCCNLFHT